MVARFSAHRGWSGHFFAGAVSIRSAQLILAPADQHLVDMLIGFATQKGRNAALPRGKQFRAR
jgi:hypothetical protein